MSTQAIYTHFGGMPGLFETLVVRGFHQLAAAVDAIPETDDPVVDHFSKDWALVEWARTHPQQYRLMMGLTGGDLRMHEQRELGSLIHCSASQFARCSRRAERRPTLGASVAFASSRATPSTRAAEVRTVDAVISQHLLWTLPRPEVAVTDWGELTRPGGRMTSIDGYCSEQPVVARARRRDGRGAHLDVK